MKISFASERPAGTYALALPVWTEDMISDRLGSLDPAARAVAARAAEAQRFEREAASVAETFVVEGEGARRLLLIGLGDRRQDDSLFEKVGGALTARLLTSARPGSSSTLPASASKAKPPPGSASAPPPGAGASTAIEPSSPRSRSRHWRKW